MSLYRWHRSAVFAAFVVCGCGESVEAGNEHAATKAQALQPAIAIPGFIRAASDYSRAFDSTPNINYGAYTGCDRGDGVDLDRSGDDPIYGQCVVGWTTAGEWLEYDITTASTQDLDITSRVAADLPDRQFHISIDGVSLGEQTIRPDNDWDYTYATYTDVLIRPGAHVLRFTFDSDDIDLNYINLAPSYFATKTAPEVESLLPAVAAVASSQESDAYPASLVTDGDSSTRWSSHFSDPQWIYLDLGKTQQVSRVILNWEAAASASYEIDVSDNSDGPWTAVYSTTMGNGGIDDIPFPPIAARYVRMYSTARLGYFGVSLYDFDVYGEAAPDPSCTSNIAAAPDDGAKIATGSLAVPQPSGIAKPAPILSPTWIAPNGTGCGYQCLNSSVIDGNTLAANPLPNYVSGILIYERAADGTWSRPAGASDFSQSTTFGPPLALSGDELFVSGSKSGSGRIYIYDRNIPFWSFKQTLPINQRSSSTPVLDHGTALITTDQDVRVYQRGSNGLYRLQAVFDGQPGGFGSQVALDGDVAVVGAASGAGSSVPSYAYVYERCGTLWTLVQALPAPDGLGTNFGASVSVSGDQIAVGEPYTAGPTFYWSGAVQTYVRQGSEWVPDQRIVNPLVQDGSSTHYGSQVALHHHLLLVGYSESNRFPFYSNYDTLFDVNGSARFLAALPAIGSQTVQLSDHEALLNPTGGSNTGVNPSVFDLPQ
jgi:F5/8 type C domain/Carbohydrate binding module (family 6)